MKKNKGFTLIELMVAVAVFAILMAFAAPNLSDFSERNRLASQTNILVAHLNLARSEAVKRNRELKICISNPAHNACTTTGKWEDGWMIFIDANSDNDYATADGDTLIQVGDALGGGITVRSTQFANLLTYNNDGSVTSAGTFKVCNEAATLSMARALVIRTAGHVTLGKDPDDDGIPNDHTNTELTTCT